MTLAARLIAPAVILLVTLAVAGPLLAPGYVFALDHALGPEAASFYARYVTHNDDAIQSKGGYALLLLALDALMPMWAAQKLLLFAPFAIAGLGARALARGRASEAAALFAGLLYMLSPFAYVRGVAGQTGVLWAYALAPWFLRAWMRHVETGSRRALASAALLVAATLVFQAHGVVLLALLVAMQAMVRLARAPAAWRATLRAPAALAAWSLALNAYWLIPVLLAPSTTLDAIGAGDRDVFATRDAGLPSVGLAALTLQGFWREGYDAAYPSAWLLVAPALVLLLAVHGLRARRDDAGVALAVAGVLSLLLAVGTGSRATAWLADLAWDHVPGMRGFRDAHKLLALLVLAYAYHAPVGFDALRASLARWRPPHAAAVATLVLLAVPFASAAPLLGGYGGQLGATDYPLEWAEVEEKTAGCDGTMVVLPWHLYLDARWLPNEDRRVTQPAKLYFSCPAITSDRLGLGEGASQASTPQVAYVDSWIARASEVDTLGNLLSPVRARFVLLLKEADWQAVQSDLDAQRDLEPVLDNARLRLYKNLAPVAPQVAPARVVAIGGPDELLALSRERPLAGLALGGPDAPEGAEVVLATPHPRAASASWTMEGRAPLFLGLGFAPVFEGDAAPLRDAEATRLAAPLWALAGIALIVLWLWSRAERPGPAPNDRGRKYEDAPEES